MKDPTSTRVDRRKRDLASVIALSELLKRIADDPTLLSTDPTLANALRSQGKLAKYERASAGIVAMSLNHQRAICDLSNLLGGYGSLNELRISALQELHLHEQRGRRGNSRTKPGLTQKVTDLEHQIMRLKQDLIQLQRAYDIRCSQARHYANEAGTTVRAICDKEQAELDAMFSIRRKAQQASGSTVVEIEERLRRGKNPKS
jgi:hypothetical protein